MVKKIPFRLCCSTVQRSYHQFHYHVEHVFCLCTVCVQLQLINKGGVVHATCKHVHDVLELFVFEQATTRCEKKVREK